jgi:hypothetical protein
MLVEPVLNTSTLPLVGAPLVSALPLPVVFQHVEVQPKPPFPQLTSDQYVWACTLVSHAKKTNVAKRAISECFFIELPLPIGH